MQKEYRFDRFDIKAVRTSEGFIYDTPNLTRSGIFPYRSADGTVRKEYRPPEVVFNADSLQAFKGIPITHGHPGFVDSSNARRNVIGSVLSEGRQVGDHIQADIVLYDTAAVDLDSHKELSVGYKVLLDYTPGTTPEGEAYDAVQKLIIPNHLAVVPKGRALTARLNLDAADEAAQPTGAPLMIPENTKKMLQIRLDNGLDYDAAPEVAQEFTKLKEELKTLHGLKEQLEARADSLQADLQTAQEQAEAQKEAIFASVKARLALEEVASKYEVKFDGLSDVEVQARVVQAIKGDKLCLEGRSDAYIEAAYDLALQDQSLREEVKATSRELLTETRLDASDSLSAAQLREKHILNGGR